MKKVLAGAVGALIMGLVVSIAIVQRSDTVRIPDGKTDAGKSTGEQGVLSADRMFYSSIKELKDNSEIVIAGTVRKQLQTYNLSRDAQDSTKENTEFVVLGTDYEVAVDKYIKGTGDTIIVVTQEGGEPNGNQRLTDERTPMQIGSKYVFFLNRGDDGKHMFGGEPSKFKLSNGKAKVDSKEAISQQKFKEMSETDFLNELKK